MGAIRWLGEELGTDRQLADALSGSGEDGIGDCRDDRRHWRLAQTERFRGVAIDDVNFDRRRVAHASNGEVGKGALLGGDPAKSDLAFERGGDAPNDATFHLLLDSNGIDDSTAIDRCDNAPELDVVIRIHHEMDDVRDISVTEISIASHAAAMTFPGSRRAPAGFGPVLSRAPAGVALDQASRCRL